MLLAFNVQINSFILYEIFLWPSHSSQRSHDAVILLFVVDAGGSFISLWNTGWWYRDPVMVPLTTIYPSSNFNNTNKTNDNKTRKRGRKQKTSERTNRRKLKRTWTLNHKILYTIETFSWWQLSSLLSHCSNPDKKQNSVRDRDNESHCHKSIGDERRGNRSHILHIATELLQLVYCGKILLESRLDRTTVDPHTFESYQF